jgi:hypothetical protein
MGRKNGNGRVTFVDEIPPKRKRGRSESYDGKYDKILKKLKDHHSRWALIGTYDSNTGAWTAKSYLTKKKRGWNGGQVEVEARRSEKGKGSHLYARYVGQIPFLDFSDE